MKSKAIFLAAILGLLTVQVMAEESEFSWNGRVGAGQYLEVRGINGDIEAELADGSQVEVIAYKSARRSDPEDVEIRVMEHERGVTICALYPTPPGREPNECVPFGGCLLYTSPSPRDS